MHERGWASVLGKAATENYYRYAIYASRTIFVEHPEIYLKADILFMRNMEDPRTLDIDLLNLHQYEVVLGPLCVDTATHPT